MVAALGGAGKFYGSSLPRPRFYADVKLNGERIDPPLPVMDALMAWAEEAHWSMGGVSTTRRRVQGRIEGNVNKLRVQRETLFKRSGNQQKSAFSPAPAVIERRRVIGLVDEEEEEEEEQSGNKRVAARNSWENFGKVGGKKEGGGVAAAIKRSKRKEADLGVVEVESSKAVEKSNNGGRVTAVAVAGIRRSSRRLAKNGP